MSRHDLTERTYLPTYLPNYLPSHLPTSLTEHPQGTTLETLRHWLQFWQLRTWIHDNLCYLTIKSDPGQHSQFLRCFFFTFSERKKDGKKCSELCQNCSSCRSIDFPQTFQNNPKLFSFPPFFCRDWTFWRCEMGFWSDMVTLIWSKHVVTKKWQIMLGPQGKLPADIWTCWSLSFSGPATSIVGCLEQLKIWIWGPGLGKKTRTTDFHKDISMSC